MKLDRASVLRDAHAETRRRSVPCHYQRHGYRYDAKQRAWMPTEPYRAIFARCLRDTWRAYKLVAAEEARAAKLPPISDDVFEQAAAIRADAWFEPINASGNTRYAAALFRAREITANARASSGYFGKGI